MGRVVENSEYVAAMRRMMRALRRRTADSDPEDVAAMVALALELDQAIGEAVAEMRARSGFSWTQIGEACGISRQAAQQRWARFAPAGDPAGGDAGAA
jgi:hypothetical protein